MSCLSTVFCFFASEFDIVYHLRVLSILRPDWVGARSWLKVFFFLDLEEICFLMFNYYV